MIIDNVSFTVTNSWESVLGRAGIPYRTRSTGVLITLCPFHNEKTPSCHYWPKSGQFHCHGCGMTGDKLFFVVRRFLDPAMIDFLSLEKLEQILSDHPWIICSDDHPTQFPDTGTLTFPAFESWAV